MAQPITEATPASTNAQSAVGHPPADTASPSNTVFAPAGPMPTAEPLTNPYDLPVNTAPPVKTTDKAPPTSGVPPVFAEPITQTTIPQAPTEPPPPPAIPEPPLIPSVISSLQSSDLINIKQQALQNLSPLIDKLEQTPEEAFKTLMMLIQASDNAELVKKAYVAANSITDEKARAQALLDIVNEINYFTQKDKK